MPVYLWSVSYVGFRSGATGRDMAAYLCCRYPCATLRELSDRFGLNHPDSASNLSPAESPQSKPVQPARRRVGRVRTHRFARDAGACGVNPAPAISANRSDRLNMRFKPQPFRGGDVSFRPCCPSRSRSWQGQPHAEYE